MPKSVLGKHGLRVLREQCSTCIFHPGNLMQLHPGRLKDMIDTVKEKDGFVICHQTLETRVPGAICRGSYDNLFTTPVQLAERLGFIEWRNPPRQRENQG